MAFRTDIHNNPAAFTTDIAKQAGLVEGVDYVKGNPFPDSKTFFTAKLLRNPVELTILVINRIGFYTKAGSIRWTYTPDLIAEMEKMTGRTGSANDLWSTLDISQKRHMIGVMYHHEGGTEMKALFT